MNIKKKGLMVGSLLLSASLALSACGTSSSDNASDTTNPSTPGGGITGRKINVAFSAPGADHGWTAAITTDAKAEAAKYSNDINFQLLEGVNDSAAQVAQVKSLIAQKPDVLVILPNDGAALTPVAKEAMAAGIQVINVDRTFTDPGAARATVLGDNYGAGYQAGQYFGDQLKCTGNVVEIQGIAGIQVTEDRSKGFRDGITAKCGASNGIKIVASQPADFSPDKGLSVMNNILQAQSNINAVYTHDDDMAQGVVQAIKNAKRDNQMWVTGVGGSMAAFDQIKQGGIYRATFIYNPSMAASAVNMARLLGQGKGLSDLTIPSVPSQIVFQASPVTQANVDQYYSLGF